MQTRFFALKQTASLSACKATRTTRIDAMFAVVATLQIVFLDPIPSFGVQQDVPSEGQRVMVVRDGVQFRVKGESQNAPAPLGIVLEVSKVNDQWLWFKGQRGWLNQSDVVLYDKAIDYFTAEIQRDPSPQAYRQRGIAHAAMANFENSVADFTEVIRRDQDDVATYNDRGNALRKLGRFDKALADFTAVIDRGVRHPAVYTNRGLVRYGKQEYDLALIDFNAAIALDDRYAPAWDAGGAAREAMGDFAKAIANYKQAVDVDSNFDRGHNNLAWILATHPDPQIRNAENAVRHATKACDLTSYSDAGYLDTLAAAYAEAGQFDQAIKRAKEAIEKASTEEKAAIQARLELYESGKTFTRQE